MQISNELIIFMVIVQAGSIGVFYTALIQEAIRVRDAPVSSTITASVNVVYVET
jgi:hypothetical protein